jgi:hypothetical protein
MSQNPKDAASKDTPYTQKYCGANIIIHARGVPVGVASQIRGRKLRRYGGPAPVVQTYLVPGPDLDSSTAQKLRDKWQKPFTGTLDAQITVTEHGQKLLDKLLKTQE